METKIRIVGTLRGAFWWPIGEPWEKDARQTFVRHRPAGPFEREAETLRDALLEITNDGDSSNACLMLGNSFLEVVRESNDGRRKRSRIFPLSMFPSVSDLVSEEWPEI